MRALAFVAVLLLAGPAMAYPDPDDGIPVESACAHDHDKRFVFDFIGTTTPGGRAVSENLACTTYLDNSAHLVVALVASTEGETIDTYALRLFEQWGIGDDERLDGLLFIYAADAAGNGDAARIEVGFGLEHIVNAVIARDAIEWFQAEVTRQVDAGVPYDDAVAGSWLAAFDKMTAFVAANHEGPGPRSAGYWSDADNYLWWMVPGIVILVAVAVGAKVPWWMFFAFLRGGRGGRGPGGGGGFDGGRSGGGGWQR